ITCRAVGIESCLNAAVAVSINTRTALRPGAVGCTAGEGSYVDPLDEQATARRSTPRVATGRAIRSEHAGAPHDTLGFQPDVARDLVRISLLVLGEKQLDRQRPVIASLLRQLLEDGRERTHTFAGNNARVVVEQLARDVWDILEMDMTHFAGLEQIEILELVVPGPEVITVDQWFDVRIRRRTRHT